MNGHVCNHLSVRSSKAFYNTQSCRIPQTCRVFDPRQVPAGTLDNNKIYSGGEDTGERTTSRKTTEGLETPSNLSSDSELIMYGGRSFFQC